MLLRRYHNRDIVSDSNVKVGVTNGITMQEEEATENIDNTLDKVDYSDYDCRTLKSLCKQKGLKPEKTAKKDELIKLLEGTI